MTAEVCWALCWLHVGLCCVQVGSMLAQVGSRWVVLAPCWLKMPASWLQDGSRWLYVGSSWPQDVQNGLPRPPRCFRNASGRLQDEVKIEIFEVSPRKMRKCIWSYYSNVFLIFFG